MLWISAWPISKMVTSYFESISVMEAVSPGLSKPVIRIKISSVLVSIHKMLLFTDCKSTQFNPIKLSFGDSFFSMEWMNLCYITYFLMWFLGVGIKTPYLYHGFLNIMALIIRPKDNVPGRNYCLRAVSDSINQNRITWLKM